MSKKINSKESLLGLTPNPPPNSEFIEVSLWPISSQGLNPLDYATKHRSFHPTVGSIKTAIKEEWNKMTEELIFKAY